MKITSLALFASVVANLALVVVIASYARVSQTLPASLTASAPATREDAVGNRSPSNHETTDEKDMVPADEKWLNFDSGDLPKLVGELREAGFPRSVLAAIVKSLVTQQFDTRRLEIEKPFLDTPYWTLRSGNSFMDPSVGPALRSMSRDQMQQARELLGGSIRDLFADTPETLALFEQSYGDLAGDKLDRAYDVTMSYADRRMKNYFPSVNAFRTNDDNQKLVDLEKSERTDLGKSLSPPEVDDLIMRSGTYAVQLQLNLSAMHATEGEYRAIYPLYESFREQFPLQNLTDLPPDQANALKVAKDQLNAELTGILGASRAADYQQVVDPVNYGLTAIVTRLELPTSTISDVNTLKRDVQQKVKAISSDNTLSTDDRNAQLTALSNETTAQVGQALGASGLEAYKRYAGTWLTKIAPRSQPIVSK